MNCNKDIHNELIEMGESNCPFCDQLLMEVDPIPPPKCCDRLEIINVDGTRVCRNCGQVDGYENVKEYVNFYENMWKFRRKSVYHRKYHIENVIHKFNIQVPRIVIEKIFIVFDEIDKILPFINPSFKRMINISFIIKKLLETWYPEITSSEIKINKSKQTLKCYELNWRKIQDLIGDKIMKIMKMNYSVEKILL